ncbi:MAG TPA: DUF5010 domain-containing protein [Candidatus Latescibacteria bacterium]|nr:DUF5010 domain-containing protein [Candidatus Latescibacterota bacterium]HOS64743.1 DUF5010 domain-containing protein [Candidatus Latescibacterota bacterium]HPK73589.1 DUF5010 domain-containing protein [Candidatus Latescibacterota bacterium]
MEDDALRKRVLMVMSVVMLLSGPETASALGRPLWATCTFGSPRAEVGLTLTGTTNVSTSNGKTYVQQNTTSNGVLSFSVAPAHLDGVAHGVFVIVDADSGSGDVAVSYRAQTNTTFVLTSAVEVRTQGAVTKRVFWLDTLDVSGGIAVVFSGFGARGITLRTVRVWGAPGPYVFPAHQDFAGRSFSPRDPLVLTYYFYWYDVYGGSHMRNGDGSDALQDHPQTTDDFSFKSVDWHVSQMRDMIEAGIDVVLPVYWGGSVEMTGWSVEGIEKLVIAQQQMRARGENPPQIGMFFDTSTLEYTEQVLKFGAMKSDLTTPFGKAFFFKQIRDFFSLIPPEMWARVNGQPLVVLYGAGFASRHDQSTITTMYDLFGTSFGGLRPFVIKEVSWQVYTPFEYAWGAALNGPNGYTGTAAVGPGYNDSAVPGRTTPVRDRENGEFYKRSWRQALSWGRKFVLVETWNEFHEGTDIARSREYGDYYIRLTRQFADIHKGPVRFSDPQPSGWVRTLSTNVSIRAEVDNVARLDPLSVECRYSTDSGATWMTLPARAVAQGDSLYLLTAENVPFGQASTALATPNRFMFVIRSAVGDTAFESLPQPVWLGYPPSAEGSVVLGAQNNEQGLHHVLMNAGDGWTAPGSRGDRGARCNLPQSGQQGSYFYFQVDDSLICNGSDPEAWVEVTYWDGEGTWFELQYDSRGTAFLDAYKAAGRRSITGVQEWRTTTFNLKDAWFGNRQNGGSDFRVYANGTAWIHQVRVYTKAHPAGVTSGPPKGQPLVWMGDPQPNPFNSSVLVPLRIPDGRTAVVSVVNAAGQVIRQWNESAGSRLLAWDGTDKAGRPLGSGVYFVRVQCGETALTRRVTLFR